jgi:hypothetical protein
LGQRFTIASWINADSAGESNVGEIFDKGTNSYCRTDNPSGTSLDVECGLNLSTTPASVNISAPITTGDWNHVAVTYTNDSDDEITVWVNGQNVGSSTNGVDAVSGHGADGNALLIGGDSAANFDGRIDDFRMYAYEMTATQMLRLYNEGAAVRFGPQTGSP